MTIMLDSVDTAFFARELEARKSQTYDIIKAPLKAMELIPVSTEAGPGAETIAYEQYDASGLAKIIGNYATDLPRADVKGREFISKIRSIGSSFGYSLQEIRAARLAGKPLEQRKANAAARMHRELWNRIAFYGDAQYTLPGLLTNLNITEADAPAGTGGTTWLTKTPDEILADLNALVNNIVTLTNGAEIPDTVVLPVGRYAKLASTPRSSTSDATILQYFMANNPFIKSVTWANELTAANMTANGMTRFQGEIAFAYRKSPDVLTLEMPQMFEMLPIQEQGLEFVTPCHSRIGGVLVYYPLACAFLDLI